MRVLKIGVGYVKHHNMKKKTCGIFQIQKKRNLKKSKKQEASKKTHDTSCATLPHGPYGFQWTSMAALCPFISEVRHFLAASPTDQLYLQQHGSPSS